MRLLVVVALALVLLAPSVAANHENDGDFHEKKFAKDLAFTLLFQGGAKDLVVYTKPYQFADECKDELASLQTCANGARAEIVDYVDCIILLYVSQQAFPLTPYCMWDYTE